MSELGILQIKSENRRSLYIEIGGLGVETRIRENVLEIRTKNCMIGYLNHKNPFDNLGWFSTRDKVSQKGNFIKILGREDEMINSGGLKYFPREIEEVALNFPNVELVKVRKADNPFTGMHAELDVQVNDPNFIKKEFQYFLRNNLPSHMNPAKVNINNISINRRYKKD